MSVCVSLFVSITVYKRAVEVEWLISWLAEQEVEGSNLGLATLILEIGYLQLRNQDMTKILLKQRKVLKSTKPNYVCLCLSIR